MKKTILIAGLVVLALGVLGVGAVFAQGVTPPVQRGGMMGGGGYGPMHDYVEEALADKLGITEKAVEDARRTVAACLNCAPAEIIFTGCGSEADNLALRGGAGQEGGGPSLSSSMRNSGKEGEAKTGVSHQAARKIKWKITNPDADAVESRTCVPFGAGLGLRGDLDPQLGMAGAQAHNRWLAGEIQESLDDPRPSLPHDEVMAAMDAEIDAVERQRAGTARRKGA